MVRTGKTLTAIHLANKAGATTLTIVPKKLKKQWQTELKTHATVKHDVLTKEEFSKLAPTLPKYDTIIVDEAHHFSGMKSQMSKRLEKYIKVHNPTHVYLLTGTPYRSSPWNIYRLATILGHKWDFFDFRKRFFTERYIGRGVVYMPRKDCQEDMAMLVRSIGSVVRLTDCTDMPSDLPPVVEEFDLTKEQVDLIETIQATETDFLARFTKYHQAASGVYGGNEFEPSRSVTTAKDNRILELIRDNERILVFARYNAQLDHLATVLKSHNIPHVIVNGSTYDPDKARQEVRDLTYGAGLIQISGAEGYDFSGYNVAVYASLSYSLLDFEQSQGRIKHMNKKTPNAYIILNCKDSADEPVWESIGNKQSFSTAIFGEEGVRQLEQKV
jgi:superfamily II DNA or RNA helicase